MERQRIMLHAWVAEYLVVSAANLY